MRGNSHLGFKYLPILVVFLILAACGPAPDVAPRQMAAANPALTPPSSPTATKTAVPPSSTPTTTETSTPTITPTLPDTPTVEVTQPSVPTNTPELTDIPLPTNTPTITPTPVVIHGLSADQIIILPEDVVHHARNIFLDGQNKGRDPNHFSLMGDSTIDTTQFLAHFDSGAYNLGAYTYLGSTIDYFAGSFARPGVAVRQGFSANLVMDPMWADKEVCRPNEHALACEIRLHNPALMLIKLGTNDSSYLSLDENMREVVRYAIVQGVIPVLGTKANRIEGDNSYNNVLRRIAADYALPLWDFDLLADKLPNRGLDQDNIHLIAFQEADYTLSYALWSGYGPLNLTAIMMLDALRQKVIIPAAAGGTSQTGH
jgi:hypothetical protein